MQLLNSQFEHLFSPLDLGPVVLRNRIFLTPHATMFASDDRDNLPGETLALYCAERAKGGAALIEVSMAIVGNDVTSHVAPSTSAHYSHLNGGHPMILSGRWPLRGNDPEIVRGYSRLAKLVHEHGAKCFMELASAGSNIGGEFGVSAFPWPMTLPFTNREIDEDGMERTAHDYGLAAKYVKEAGLDGVDILAAHGELLAEFLSGVMNRRNDRYGGTIENRTRFPIEVIERIREYTGSEIAVGMRINGDERFKGGNTPAVAAEIARLFDGKLDWITASPGYSPQQEDWQAVPMYVESGYNLRITNPIKSVLKKTRVGIVGKYLDPVYSESLLASGLADMVAMTRALIADPELPNKAREGKLEEIRPCIGVLQDCWGRMIRGLPISCTVNPAAGREREWGMDTLKPASVRKRVLVIGGGVAGLEVARIASERGHEVVVYEKSREAGGQALLAGGLPGRENIKAIVVWLTNQVARLDVQVRYGMEITPDPDLVQYVISEEKPDAVVIATGSAPIRTGFQPYNFQEIEGWNSPGVITDVDVLEGGRTTTAQKIGKNVIIADSLGFIEAPGIAELLARRPGSRVEVVTFFDYLGLELKLYNHWEHLLPRLFRAGVKVSPFTWIKKIEDRSVLLYNVYLESDQRQVEDIDNVILITGKVQNDSLYSLFEGKVKEIYRVGDANVGGARLGNAMYDGQRVGRLL